MYVLCRKRFMICIRKNYFALIIYIKQFSFATNSDQCCHIKVFLVVIFLLFWAVIWDSINKIVMSHYDT